MTHNREELERKLRAEAEEAIRTMLEVLPDKADLDRSPSIMRREPTGCNTSQQHTRDVILGAVGKPHRSEKTMSDDTTDDALITGTLLLLSVTAFVAFIGALLALHALDPQDDLDSHLISEYARGDYGLLFGVALVVLGIGSGMLTLGLRPLLTADWQARFAQVTLLIWSLGACLAGIFPTDPAGTPVSASGYIHSFAAVAAFIALTASIFFFAAYFRQDDRWNPLITQILAVALVLMLVGFFASPTDLQGLTGRIFLVLVASSLIYLALTGLQHIWQARV